MFVSKSLLTNLIALILLMVSFFLPQQWQKYLLYTALFALSGALTNWLAVHMIFHKVPLLYGSGVIERNFEKFKMSLQQMVMEQFFTCEKIDNLLGSYNPKIDLVPLVLKVDLSPIFLSLKATILDSKFGGVIGMIGGESLIDNQKELIIETIRNNIVALVSSEHFSKQLDSYMKESHLAHDIATKIESLVSRRINELTPLAVKELVLDLIHVHLGWLVVWGGVFGGLLGLISSFVF